MITHYKYIDVVTFITSHDLFGPSRMIWTPDARILYLMKVTTLKKLISPIDLPNQAWNDVED